MQKEQSHNRVWIMAPKKPKPRRKAKVLDENTNYLEQKMVVCIYR